VAQVAVFSQINTKHINTVWAERTVVECEALKGSLQIGERWGRNLVG